MATVGVLVALTVGFVLYFLGHSDEHYRYSARRATVRRRLDWAAGGGARTGASSGTPAVATAAVVGTSRSDLPLRVA